MTEDDGLNVILAMYGTTAARMLKMSMTGEYAAEIQCVGCGSVPCLCEVRRALTEGAEPEGWMQAAAELSAADGVVSTKG